MTTDHELREMPLDELRRLAERGADDPASRAALAVELRRRASQAKEKADAGPMAVRVADIDMPFMSMVIFMVKWALASIPAIIILFMIVMMLAGLSGGVLAGLLRSLLH